jgi:quercetin dioxygenase-like cupin family protein
VSLNGPASVEPITRRPVVTDLEVEPHRRRFTVTLEPGQQLPPHRNPSRVVITVVEGYGEITVDGDGRRVLPLGAVVQFEPNVEHAVLAGDTGLELMVQLVANCCEHC